MNRFFKIVLVLALLVGVAHADFVGGNTSLPTTKTNLHPLPSTADPTKYFQAADYNALMNAELDLRTAIVNGAYHGLAEQATDPLPVNATNYEWLDTAGILHLKIGATGALVPFCAPTSGQVCQWNGTNWTAATISGGGASSFAALYSSTPANNVVTESAAGGPVTVIGAASAVENLILKTSNLFSEMLEIQDHLGNQNAQIDSDGYFGSVRGYYDPTAALNGISTPTAGGSALLSNGHTLTVPQVTDTLAVLGTAQTFTAAQTINPSSDSIVGMSIQNHSSTQTTNLFQTKDSTGAVRFAIQPQDANGNGEGSATLAFTAASGAASVTNISMTNQTYGFAGYIGTGSQGISESVSGSGHGISFGNISYQFMSMSGTGASASTTTWSTSQSFHTTAETTTIAAGDHIIAVDTTAARAFTLPSATGSGRELVFCDSTNSAGTNNITINRTGTDTINGGTSVVVNTNSGTKTLRDIASGKWVAY